MPKKVFYPYSWHIDDDVTAEDITIIRIYGLDKNNKSVCVIVNGFQPYVYIELPNIGINWTESKANMLGRKIDEECGIFKPITKNFKYMHKLYYANVKKDINGYKHEKFPFLLCTFSCLNDVKKFCGKMNRTLKVPGLPLVKVKVHEREANPILQFICTKNLTTTGWLIVKGDEITDEDEKSSYCSQEFVIKCQNIQKVKRAEYDHVVPKPLIMSFDLEVNSTNVNQMPKAQRPGDKIFQISLILSQQGNYENTVEKHLITLGNPLQNIVGDDVNIINCQTEADLLMAFRDFIIQHNPQLMVGYNIFSFDVPYLIERARLNMITYSFDQLDCRKGHHCPEDIIKWSSSAYKNQEFRYMKTEGRVFVDLLPLVQRDYKFDNYKLKTISTFFLGETKDPLTPKGIFKCYSLGMAGGERGDKAMGVVGKYCIQDSVLVTKLIELMEIWVGLTEMAKICYVPIFTLYTQGQQIKVYSQVYMHCMYTNYVVESNGYITKDSENYTGATVVQPVPGAYDRVIPFDFTSLYPTTMIAHNIDYSKLVPEDNTSIPDEHCNVIEWDDHIGCEHDTTVRKTKPKNIICGHNHYRFLKSEISGLGVMPTLLKNLLSARTATKKEIKEIKKILQNETLPEEEKKLLIKKCVVLDKRQLAYKVSANSMYGSMGVRKGYLPFLPGAMCTTAKGRQSITKAGEYIQKHFQGQLVYGDTDSCYIHFPQTKTAQACWDYALEVENKVSDLFPKPMRLLFEEVIYWRFFILTKKRYMALSCGRDGIVSDKIMKKGVLLARRDNSKWLRDLYEEVIMKIFNRNTEIEVKDLILENINKLCSGGFPRSNFIVTKSIGDLEDYKIRELPSDAVKYAKRMKDLGINPLLSKPEQLKLYRSRNLPAQVQLAERLRRRGHLIDAGSRIEYVVTMMGGLKAKQYIKIEDPLYVQEHISDIKDLRLDYLHYLKLAMNPLDQVLSVAFGLDKFVETQYKFRCKRWELCRKIENITKSTVEFIDD